MPPAPEVAKGESLLGPRIFVIALIAGYVVLHRATAGELAWQITLGLTVLLFGRTVISLLHRPSVKNPSRVNKVALVVPFYNESDEGLRTTFASILSQTRLPDVLYIINDGSSTGSAEVMLWLPTLRARIKTVEYFDVLNNRGKRSALAAAFKSTDCDIVVTSDSDTTLDQNAITEIIRPFASRKVTAATGRIGVRNRSRNPLTFLQDVVYGIAFLHGRAALSQMGSVLVCSGALSAYRRSVIEPHLDDFVLRPWMFGEDRHLTNYALRHGRVVLQDSAIARTDVPANLRHYLRQQTRWQRGFLQNSVWALQKLPLNHRVFWMTFGNSTVWLLFTLLMPFALVSGIAGTVLFHGFLAHMLLSWAHLARYIRMRGQGRFWIHLSLLIVGPFLGFIQTVLLTPVRLYALGTFRAKGWGSRIRAELPARVSTGQSAS
jgi:hyaluronan synthase